MLTLRLHAPSVLEDSRVMLKAGVSTEPDKLELQLDSPVSLKKVISFGLIFLAVQVVGTLIIRWLGNSGVLLVSLIGGAVSSASTTAAAANLLVRGNVTPLQSATATVLTSIASTAMNLPIVIRQVKDKAVVREIVTGTILQAVLGVLALCCELWFLH